MWGATLTGPAHFICATISIHAPRVGSDRGIQAYFSRCFDISIHAPRVGSDETRRRAAIGELPISIHAPRVGSDHAQQNNRACAAIFQSTLPVWGATQIYRLWCPDAHISIHAPRVGSDVSALLVKGDCLAISIHAPRVGSDGAFHTLPSFLLYFNPRSPCGERPCCAGKLLRAVRISIHAPRVGSDIKTDKIQLSVLY